MNGPPNYVEVKDRIADIRAKGREVGAGFESEYEIVHLTHALPIEKVERGRKYVAGWTEPQSVPYVIVKALYRRSADDPHPAVGLSWMQVPGATNFTRGSELENTETSAWGRALIAALEADSRPAIASQDEIRKAEGERELPVLGVDGWEDRLNSVLWGKYPSKEEAQQRMRALWEGCGGDVHQMTYVQQTNALKRIYKVSKEEWEHITKNQPLTKGAEPPVEAPTTDDKPDIDEGVRERLARVLYANGDDPVEVRKALSDRWPHSAGTVNRLRKSEVAELLGEQSDKDRQFVLAG